MKRVTYFGVFEPVGNGEFSVYFPDLPGCTSYGETLGDAQKNAKDALGLHLYGLKQDGDPIPAPSTTPEVDPETAAGYLVCLVTAKVDKTEAFKHFLSLFPEKGLDLDPEEARKERLR